MQTAADARRPAFVAGGGTLGALIRDHDWAGSPLGMPETWPQSLRSALSICLHSQFPTALYWGPEFRLLYNDAWQPVVAERHPWALGRPAAEVWSDIWPVVGPQLARVVETGEGFSTFDQLLPMVRGGLRRETYWNYSFTPIHDEDGTVLGVLNQGHETTERVLGDRRGRFLLELSDRLRSLSDPRAVVEAAEEALGEHLNANRVGYGEVDESARYFTTERNWTDGSVPSREGTHDLAGFGPDVLASLRAGVPLLIQDAATDPRTSAPESLAAFDAIDTRAAMTASLVKDGRMRAALYVHAREPRPWTDHDASLVTEVAERTWSAVERARAEERLRQSEARFRGVFDARLTGLSIFDAHTGETLAINDTFLAMTGHTRADFDEGRWDWRDFTLPEYLHLDEKAVVQACEQGWCEPYEKEYRRQDGTRFPVRIASAPLPGEPGQVVVSVQDISERRAAEIELRESETRFRNMADNAPVMMWVTDPSGSCTYLNAGWYEFTGQRPGAGEGYGWLDAIHPDDRPAAEAAFAAANAERRNYRIDFRLRRADGAYRWVIDAAAARFAEDGQYLGYVGSVIDIDERREAEERLRASEARFRAAIDAVQGVLWTNNVQGEMTEEQPGWAALTGQTPAEYRGYGWADAVHPEDAQPTIEAWNEALNERKPFLFEHRVRGHDGAWRVFSIRAIPTFEADGSIREWVGVHTDVTDLRSREAELRELNATLETRIERALAAQRATEEALRQSQKMEAVGQLTGGIAHDFNNLLTIIRSSTDLLRRQDLPEERRRRYVGAISETVDRAAKITGQLLAFARRQALRPEIFDAAERLGAVIEMLHAVIGSRIVIRTEKPSEPCFVEADASQFETALVNMALNARDAMNGEGVLILKVETGDRTPSIQGGPEASSGFVAISLSDTGHGIPADKLPQIFEPFFTTKEVGKGTGLGLSQVYGFAKQSGGDVRVESEPGQGATFTLYLPRAERGNDRVDGTDVALEWSDTDRGQRVLVVEDNIEVGRVSTQILEDLGYETAWATSAAEALRLLEEGDDFDVVFSDVVMPGMSGIELGQEIRRRRPDLPVVLTSGYSHVLAEEGQHGFELLHKPYAAEELSRVLQQATRGRVARA